MQHFHGDYKTDMDWQQVLSGKFAVNQLTLDIAV